MAVYRLKRINSPRNQEHLKILVVPLQVSVTATR